MQQLTPKRVILVLLTCLVWSLVFLGSSPGAGDSFTLKLLRDWFHLEGETLHVVNFVLRKSIHVVYYGCLAFLITRSVWGWVSKSVVAAALFGAGLSLATGVLDELHQSQFSSRTGTPFDLVYDGSGILLATGLHYFLATRQRAKHGSN